MKEVQPTHADVKTEFQNTSEVEKARYKNMNAMQIKVASKGDLLSGMGMRPTCQPISFFIFPFFFFTA